MRHTYLNVCIKKKKNKNKTSRINIINLSLYPRSFGQPQKRNDLQNHQKPTKECYIQWYIQYTVTNTKRLLIWYTLERGKKSTYLFFLLRNLHQQGSCMGVYTIARQPQSQQLSTTLLCHSNWSGEKKSLQFSQEMQQIWCHKLWFSFILKKWTETTKNMLLFFVFFHFAWLHQ